MHKSKKNYLSKTNKESALKQKIQNKRDSINKLRNEIAKWKSKVSISEKEIESQRQKLNTLLKKLSKENNEFYQQLLAAEKSQEKTVFTLDQAFIKRNVKRLENVINEKNIPIDSDLKSVLSSSNRSKSYHSQMSQMDQKTYHNNIENQFIIKSLKKMADFPLPSFIDSLANTLEK